ncbi:MAG: ABC transporter ATP-binding protein, partial [Acetobacteraceae bacterium]
FSLLGPSGSGKTTTLMMIAGFVAPDAGSIRIGGRDVTGLPPQRRGLGMVFQNYALFPHLSVFENVAFPLKVRKLGGEEIRERVEKTLQTVRLREFTRRLPRELSGGQQQRVALARAIVFHPRVVLMDEPLGALDKNLRYQMQLEIKEIQERLGMTAVYVTHDQEEAMNMSDRIAIMNRGRIEQVGRPREVYEEPGCVFVAKFLGEANLIRGRLAHDGDDVRLRADSGGIFLVERGARVVDSRAAHLFVRPEKVGLAPRAETPAPEPGTNRIAGTVRRVSFLGNVVRYGIEIGEAELLLSDAQNGSGKAILPAGTEVTASWRVADARVLEDG